MKPTPLFTLTDPPRGELPGESWRACCEQERAYTLGWRMALKVGSPQACPLPDDLEPHWRMGHADGWVVARLLRAGAGVHDGVADGLEGRIAPGVPAARRP